MINLKTLRTSSPVGFALLALVGVRAQVVEMMCMIQVLRNLSYREKDLDVVDRHVSHACPWLVSAHMMGDDLYGTVLAQHIS